MPPTWRPWRCRRSTISSSAPKKSATATDAGGGETHMPLNILMPALSPTMTEGTLAKSLVKEDDAISSGDVIAEIEPDKATLPLQAAAVGTTRTLLAAARPPAVPVPTVPPPPQPE